MLEQNNSDAVRHATVPESGGQNFESLSAGLRRLSHWVHMSSWRHWATERLTPTQLKVLQILTARGEGLSLTALAQALSLTAATVCDCAGALEDKGLLTKERSARDGRQKTLRLTAAGQHASRQAAVSEPLLQAFGGLTPAEQQSLNLLWMKMNYTLEEQGVLPQSRMCVRCQFFRPNFTPGSQTPHHCDQADRPLPESAMPWDCSVFAAADPQTQAAVWDAFMASPVPPIWSEHPLESRDGNSAARALQDGIRSPAEG